MDDDEDFEDLLEGSELLEASEEPLTPEAIIMPPQKKTVIERIEGIFQMMLPAILDGKALVIPMRRRPRPGKQRSTLENPVHQPKLRAIRFPGNTAEEAWRFTVVLRILELMHEALRNDVVISKRDIYYQDPALFGQQAQVDRYVDDIAYTFGVSRSALNVIAAAKGLVAGACSFCRRVGSTIDISTDKEGLLIPPLADILSVNMQKVKWILVIEKEASFRSIAASRFWDMIQTEGIILTAKGYPDVSSRAMLRFLSSPSPQNGFSSPPVYALVDYDPDGLAIMSVYKDGSIALAHENANLCVPQLQWLGLCRECIQLGQDPHCSQGLLTLSDRDRRKATNMLERCSDLNIRSALQDMLLLNVKAELQILSASEMTDLLESRLGHEQIPGK